jgi:CRISPR-associated protein Csc3
VQDLIYIACNTQVMYGTLHNTAMLPNVRTDSLLLGVLANVSRLADLMAYIAPTPREMVANEAIDKLIRFQLGEGRGVASVARLTYHHVAENRGLLLNLIHNAALDALKIDDMRVPLLYAPSGVVYLERYDAPAMPSPADLAKTIVAGIRRVAGEKLIASGKGAKRGATSLQIDDSYDDFFSLPEVVQNSVKLVARYIRNNKTPERLESARARGVTDIPMAPTDAKDARADQITEWAAFMDRLYRDRMGDDHAYRHILPLIGVDDLTTEFLAVKQTVGAAGGVPLAWFWAGAHALSRKPGLSDVGTLAWLSELSKQVIESLPEDLPEKAQSNQAGWDDLTDYVGRVMSLGGVKSLTGVNEELKKYTRAKGGGGKACAICGSTYTVRAPKESTVAFQPGVYTARIAIGSSSNARNLCSICSLEQLLRQLFMDNLDTGSTAEGQRIRYLSFYPSYYFTPETLRFMQRAYQRLSDMRVSDKEFMAALRDADLTDPKFWQRIEMFLMPVRDEPSKRVLRYQSDAQSTFLSFGLRVFDATETESWILPALMALALAVCLDVKVVISDSGVPLMLESDELPETLWFDGAHPSVQAVMGESRINIDHVGKALARLAAAYMIHLETEYQPPKENWNRFGPIAHSLMESPLYVFHYLKKQLRDDRPPSLAQVSRYIRFAEDFFADTTEKEAQMSLARNLVTQYRRFYRAKSLKNANSILRPLSVVADALLIADPRLFPDTESLTELAYGELAKFMDRVGKGQADGRFPKGVSVPEREAGMRDFSRVFVDELFIGIFSKDVAALRGKQLNLFRDTCEALYREMQMAEWAASGKDAEDAEAEDGAEE